MDNPNSPMSAQIPPKKTRNRFSKLDEIYYQIAQLLLENSRLKLTGKRPLSLEDIADRIKKKHGIAVVKSTLSRYLANQEP